jgi:hypothetical protein
VVDDIAYEERARRWRAGDPGSVWPTLTVGFGASRRPQVGVDRVPVIATVEDDPKRKVGGSERRYSKPAAVAPWIIVLRNTSKMTAVDQPNSSTPFIAVNGPSSRQRSPGITSP